MEEFTKANDVTSTPSSNSLTLAISIAMLSEYFTNITGLLTVTKAPSSGDIETIVGGIVSIGRGLAVIAK